MVSALRIVSTVIAVIKANYLIIMGGKSFGQFRSLTCSSGELNKNAPWAFMFECLITREYNCLKGLEEGLIRSCGVSMVLMEETSNTPPPPWSSVSFSACCLWLSM